MIGLILATGSQDSQNRDRLNSIRGFIQIAGKPLVEHISDSLVDSGCDEILIVSHEEHKELYEKNFAKLFSRAPVEVTSIPEADTICSFIAAMQIAGTGESVMAVADDEIFDFSLQPMIDLRKKSGRGIVAVLSDDQIPGNVRELNMGLCTLDRSGNVVSVSSSKYHESEIDGGFVLTGIYYYEPEDTKKLLELDRSLTSPELIQAMHKELRAILMVDGFWADVGKPALHQAAIEYFE